MFLKWNLSKKILNGKKKHLETDRMKFKNLEASKFQKNVHKNIKKEKDQTKSYENGT